MCRPSHPPRFYSPNNIWRIIQIMKLLIMDFSQPQISFFLSRPIFCTYTPSFLSHQLISFMRSNVVTSYLGSQTMVERGEGLCMILVGNISSLPLFGHLLDKDVLYRCFLNIQYNLARATLTQRHRPSGKLRR